MAGPVRFWIHVFRLLAVAVVVVAVCLPATGAAQSRVRVPSAPLVGRATLDIAYGKQVRGMVAVSARVRGSRVAVVLSARRLSFPSFAQVGGGRLVLLAATLCGGRLGPGRTVASGSYSAPARGLVLAPRTVLLPLPACKAPAVLGVFLRMRLVTGKPASVLHTVSGSIPSLGRGGASHA